MSELCLCSRTIYSRQRSTLQLSHKDQADSNSCCQGPDSFLRQRGSTESSVQDALKARVAAGIGRNCRGGNERQRMCHMEILRWSPRLKT